MYRVLIVDDELPFLQSLAMFDWESYGCRCVGQATNGWEAIEKCIELAPHIVISDINMPLLDGISFLSEVNQRFPEIQVILLTVYRDFEYAQKAVNLGACDYLVKDMNYRDKLPAVLEKAKKPFEQQPSKMDYRENLLRRSGHMLVIESDDVLHAYREKVDDFLQKYSGTLITARMQQSYGLRHSLISNLDFFLSSIKENIGLIVRDTSCFELLIGKNIPAAEDWVLRILTHERLRMVGKDTRFALTACGKTLAEYKEAHAFILNAPNIRLLADKLLSTVRKMRSSQDNYSYFVVRAKEYMHSKIGDSSLQLIDVAEHVGISPGYLSKKLKEETGLTFQELLICMRMEYASELLKKSDKRVYEIAEMVGYENYRSFTLAFKKFYGISPKKYR